MREERTPPPSGARLTFVTDLLPQIGKPLSGAEARADDPWAQAILQFLAHFEGLDLPNKRSTIDRWKNRIATLRAAGKGIGGLAVVVAWMEDELFLAQLGDGLDPVEDGATLRARKASSAHDRQVRGHIQRIMADFGCDRRRTLAAIFDACTERQRSGDSEIEPKDFVRYCAELMGGLQA